jgi:hypothetical protein
MKGNTKGIQIEKQLKPGDLLTATRLSRNGSLRRPNWELFSGLNSGG